MNTTRRLHKTQKRPVRNGIRRYGLKQHAWTDETFSLIPFSGVLDKNSKLDREALMTGLVKILGNTSVSNYPFGSPSWSIERIFTFSNSGVVVISRSYSIGD